MTGDILKWGDQFQYHAEPHSGYVDEGRGVMPTVHLLWMTPDPLGAIAAMSEMYKGHVVRDLSDVTDEQRRSALVDVQKTHLQAPLEAVKLHFMIEGVDRAFTHQLVRQRTAVYAQESLRFAVPGSLLESTTLPPSLQGTTYEPYEGDPAVTRTWTKEQWWRQEWGRVLNSIDAAYHKLVDDGMPAEEARGLLPHCTATRLNYITDLRNLKDHAGNRLCCQAQFHWRAVFAQIVKAVRTYLTPEQDPENILRWQFEALADSALFRPVCYQLGHCPFQASFDRACTIRDRVEARASVGSESIHWHKPLLGTRYDSNYRDNGIQKEEWLLNPAAARKVD